MTPRPSFDLLAPVYHLLERVTFGPLLHRCRTAHLDQIAGCRRALVLGDGDGRFLADLLRANRQVRVDSLDISPGMIALARRRTAGIPGAAERARFVAADARTAPLPEAGYDLVVTNFFLDCFPPEDLESLIDRVAAGCLPGVLWLDGDFRLPAAGRPRAVARVILAGMYSFFRLTTRLPTRQLTDPAPFLAARGFTLAGEKTQLRGFLSSQVWVRGNSLAPHRAGG
ncbi:MAG: Methyltransferase domain protein [Gemmataceae bacterium]|nr:Methyltransferase domain protein [Gemmataceae bacterium]